MDTAIYKFSAFWGETPTTWLSTARLDGALGNDKTRWNNDKAGWGNDEAGWALGNDKTRWNNDKAGWGNDEAGWARGLINAA